MKRLSGGRTLPSNLDLWKGHAFIAFDQHEIARADIIEHLLERHLGSIAELAHQGKAPRGRQCYLACACLAQLEGVAAGMVDLETGMRVCLITETA